MLIKGLPQGTALHKVQGLLPTGGQRAGHDSSMSVISTSVLAE